MAVDDEHPRPPGTLPGDGASDSADPDRTDGSSQLTDAERSMPEPGPLVSDGPWERWLAEERAAQIRLSSITAGRRKAGVAGAALAGSMLVLRDIYEGPPKDQGAIEIEASGEVHDVDRDGISMIVDDTHISIPPLADPPPD